MAQVIYEFELPSGEILEVEAPDSTTQEEALSAVRNKYPEYFSDLPDQGNAQFPEPEYGNQPYLSQQYPDGARSTINIDGGEDVRNQNFVHPDGRTVSQILGASAGTILGGGNPMSGAAGYALGDLLYQKLHEDEVMTPSNATKRFGEGLAYELAPKVLFPAFGKPLSKLPYKKLYDRGLGVPPSVIQKEADFVTEAGLKNNLITSKKGIDKANEILGKNKEEVAKIIKRGAEEGATVDMEGVVRRAKENMLKDFENVAGATPDIKAIDDAAEMIMKEYEHKIPRSYTKGEGGQPVSQRNVPLDIAQAIKSQTQKKTNNVYNNVVKFGDKTDPALYKLRAEISHELRKEIEDIAPDVIPLNKQSHEVAAWRGYASPRVRHANTAPLIPTRIMAPAVIETAMKGSPQTATLLAATGVASSAAAPLSGLGLFLKNAGEVGNNLDYWLKPNRIPGGGKAAMALEGYLNDDSPPSNDFYSGLTGNLGKALAVDKWLDGYNNSK